MREICLSGSMSGNRNQNHVKPDCGDEAKANSIIHRETTVTAPVLDSTPHFTHHGRYAGHLSVMACFRQLHFGTLYGIESTLWLVCTHAFAFPFDKSSHAGPGSRRSSSLDLPRPGNCFRGPDED